MGHIEPADVYVILEIPVHEANLHNINHDINLLFVDVVIMCDYSFINKFKCIHANNCTPSNYYCNWWTHTFHIKGAAHPSHIDYHLKSELRINDALFSAIFNQFTQQYESRTILEKHLCSKYEKYSITHR